MKNNQEFLILGLMSGTSMDGLDMCLCKIRLTKDYKFDYDIINFFHEDFSSETISIIRRANNNNDILLV